MAFFPLAYSQTDPEIGGVSWQIGVFQSDELQLADLPPLSRVYSKCSTGSWLCLD
jgi:hypothetical protein